MTEVTLSDVTDNLETEEVSLTDFDEGPGGALPKGWYGATIIEGYSTGKGKVFTTSDSPSKDGNSRNFMLVLALDKSDRKIFHSFNYRTTDFSPERIAYVKELRQEFKDVRGAWPDKDGQRSSLALVGLGRLEAAVGFKIKLTPNKTIIPSIFIGQKVDVKLTVDEDDFNKVTTFAKSGEKTGK